MKKNKILILALLVCLSIPVGAQNTDSNITGIVVDKWGNPVYGASVNVAGIPDVRVETDKDGKFEIAADAGRSLQVVTTDKGSTTVKVEHGKAMKIVMDYAAQTIDVGANRTFTRQESTAAVSTVYNEDFNKRAAKNMSNSLYGQGLGLTTLQNAGNYASVEPTFYVRGLQSLSSSSPLVLVDGLERDMSLVTPEEVESVSVLKDAAAVALYGYKGVNGAILITTKRGKYNTREVTFTYDHVTNFQARRPKFVDAATYAEAINEARGYEGLSARYAPEEVDAFRNGATGGGASRMYPYLYPNVNWMDETFKDTGISNKYTIEFSGGGDKFRYYTMLGLFAASLQGKGTDPAGLVAVTDKIQCLPHSLTAALKGLHQEGLRFVIGQNLLSHFVISLRLGIFSAVYNVYSLMDTDMILLKAQFQALRDYFTSLLPTIFEHDKEKDDKVWLAKYLLWKFERELLAPFENKEKLSPLEKDKICRRRFQLQVLMDVAYIQGRLEEYDIPRIIDSYAAAQALQVFQQSGDGSEELMLPLIDKIYRPE